MFEINMGLYITGVLLLFFYYVGVLVALDLNRYDSKQEFIKDLVPFSAIFRSLYKSFNTLKG